MARLLLIPAAMLVLLIGALVWSGGGTQSRADLTFINRGEIGTLDPNRMAWMQDIRVGYCIFEGLYTLDPATLNAVPGASEPAEISADKTVYTFRIRPNARWSNGDPVTTADFVFAWKRMLQEPGDYTSLLYYIKGAREYMKAFAEWGKARSEATAKADPSAAIPAEPGFAGVGIEPLDSRTLRVTLNHPVGFFLDIIAFPCCFPLHEKSMQPFIDKDVRKATGKIVYDKRFTLPPNLLTNGAYELTSWDFKRRIRLTASQYWWNKDAVKTKSIDVVSADDYLWALTIYDTGGVDWLTDMSGELAADLLKKGRKDVHVYPGFGTYFYTFNCKEKLADGRKNPFADVRVRQAFSMAVNKQVIVDNVTRLGEPITTQYIPPYAFEKYPSPKGLGYNVERAKQLMAEAGYPGGKGFPDITLLFNSEGQHGPIAQIVRRQWQEALGVDLRLESIEINTFRQRLHNKEYAVARASWYGDYNDPSTFTDKYKSESDNNDSAWINPEYDALCAKADRERDDGERLKLFAQAEKLLLEEAPILPMYHYMNVYLYRPEQVHGMMHHSRNHQVMWPIEVKR
ncbi:peptide ABC transporter substrate-binding protein [Humisphaera borealis]|uniref:Peptide ABC transporter substrate-binding protein n=1 Tax=Humisphaera borealis TaxID=2807512 RepID=A0A7M2WVA8_9BACT|nr:peptide ABC transporter substrate-binding protein [Humisphaera borealis]QOV89254.1 peptide ABC transporter substrate-binding protein [Humisphaera borealis]